MIKLNKMLSKNINTSFDSGIKSGEMKDLCAQAIARFHEERNIDIGKMMSAYRRGQDLWKNLFNKWKELSVKSDSSGNSLAITFDSSKKDTYSKQFMDFVNQFNIQSNIIHIYVGEGYGVLDAAKNIPQQISVDMVCGPLMIRSDDSNPETSMLDCLNDFFPEILNDKNRENTSIEISINMFPSYFKGFCGYFHCFIYGDAILMEEAHEIGNIAENKAYIMLDKESAEQAVQYFSSYKKEFTYAVTNENEMCAFLPTLKKSEYQQRFILSKDIDMIMGEIFTNEG